MIDPIDRVRRLFARSSYLRNIGLLGGGTALGQLIALAASPLLTRLYTPEDFGYLALYTSVLSVLVVVADLRYSLAIPLPAEDEDALALLAISFAAILGGAVSIALVLWLGGQALAGLVGNAALIQRSWTWLLPLGLVGAAAYQALTYWAIRKRSFRQLAVTRLSQGLALVVAQVLLGVLRWGPLGLMVGDAVGRAAGVGALLRSLRREADLHWLSWQRLRAVAVRYRRFPLLSSGSALLNSLGLYLPSVLLLAMYGATVAGWFALSQRIIAVPLRLIGTSVGQVYMGEAARLARDDRPALRRLFRLSTWRLFLLTIAPAGLLALFAPSLFAWVFGSDWLEAGRYTQVLVIVFVAQMSVATLSQTLNVLERQDLQLFWDAGRLASLLLLFWLAANQGWSAYQTVAGYGVVMTAGYVALWILITHALGPNARDRVQ